MTKIEKINSFLEETLQNFLFAQDVARVDQFDFNYIDMIDFILMENFSKEIGIEKFNELKSIVELSKCSSKKDFIQKLKDENFDFKKYSPLKSPDEFKILQEYKKPSSWIKAEGIVIESGETTKINELQKEYSIQSKGWMDKIFTDLGRPSSGDVWTPLIAKMLKENMINGNKPSLTVGCRWAGEVKYFRSLGLTGMIGLDLFSREPEFVKIGDMHSMPFNENTFEMIYQRNTFDKSYDIRKALQECIRTLRSGGILIYDDVQGCINGVNELTRSNVLRNDWVFSHLRINNNIEEIIFNRQVPCEWEYCKLVGQFAVKIRK